MKPILYPPEETEFVSNGLGILADAMSCEVRQVLNGQYELTMQYPITGARFGDIKSRSIILAKTDPVSELQPFRVYEILKTSAGIVTVYAHHMAYDLKGIPITPFEANGPQLALQGIKQNAVTDCPFDFYTDISSTSAFSVAVPQPIWAVLGGQEGSLLDVFGGEYEFDCSTVKLLSSRGMNRGVTIRYGKNLTSLEQDENCANCYTGILPYYVDMETGEVSYAEGKVIYAEGEFGYTRILPVDMSAKYDEKPTPQQLKEQGEKYIRDNKVGIPDIGWTISWVQLENTEEYKGKAILERVLMGDTVSVHFPAMGISVAARAVEITYDTLLERYKDIRLGSVKASIANEIVSQGKDIEAKPSKSDMKSAISQMTNTLTGSAGGAVRLLDTNGDGKPDTLYIADDPDPDKAIKVWRFDYRGWGASETGYNGPFTMGATFEDGFLADFIRAGTLNADLIKAGILQSKDGRFSLNLETGELRVSGFVTDTITQYYLSTSTSELAGGSWSETAPEWVDGKYMWSRTKTTKGDGSVSYSAPTCIAGATGPQGVPGLQGPKGDRGVQGPKGADGKTSYTHIAYANSADGTKDFTVSNSNREYIGMYVDFSETDSTNPGDYAWSKIKGADGANGTPGKAGADGKTPYFHVAYANNATGTSGFSTTDSTNKLYIGQYTDYTQADSTDPTKYAWTKIKGDKGDTGEAGVGVKSIDVQYYLSTSPTTLTGGSWSTTAPTWVNGKYMWSKTVTTLSNGSVEESKPVCITGAKGSTGTSGTTITSITEQYYLSTSKTQQTGGSWVEKPPAWSVGKYLWTRSKIVYANPTKTEYTTPVCDSSWEAVNDMQVGGTNLLLDTDAPSIEKVSAEYDRYITSPVDGDNAVAEFAPIENSPCGTKNLFRVKIITAQPNSGTTVAGLRFYNHIGPMPLGINFIPGEQYTMSCYARKTSGAPKINMTMWGLTAGGGHDVPEAWTKFSLTFTATEDFNSKTNAWAVFSAHKSYVGTLEMTGFQIEKGNKATDWTPSPIETDEKIVQEVQKEVNFEITSGSISSTVEEITSKINNLTGRMETVESSAALDLTTEGLTLEFKRVLENANGIHISGTKHTLNEDGLAIEKEGESMKSLLNNTGLKVSRRTGESYTPVLTANDEGVIALNLKAEQYLNVGKNARFEDYGTGRTACFWVGG